jgi:hypothetical protein
MRVPDFAGKIRRELGSADDLGQVDLVVSARAVVCDRQRHNRCKRVILSGHQWPYSHHRRPASSKQRCSLRPGVGDVCLKGSEKKGICFDFKMEKPSVHLRTTYVRYYLRVTIVSLDDDTNRRKRNIFQT